MVDLGFYEFNIVPFGLANAPATFHSWMRWHHSLTHSFIGATVEWVVLRRKDKTKPNIGCVIRNQAEIEIYVRPV